MMDLSWSHMAKGLNDKKQIWKDVFLHAADEKNTLAVGIHGKFKEV